MKKIIKVLIIVSVSLCLTSCPQYIDGKTPSSLVNSSPKSPMIAECATLKKRTWKNFLEKEGLLGKIQA